MTKIISRHINNAISTIKSLNKEIKKIEKISNLIEKKINSETKFLFMVMGDLLQIVHILLVNYLQQHTKKNI